MTKPGHESIASVNLTRQGYTNYCPFYKKKQVGKPSVIRPLFARYIFIFVNQAWYSILGTRGMSRILMGDLGPQSIPTTIIDGLKQREVNGLVELISPPKFSKGDKVKADEGPLSGHLLIYDEMLPHDRVRVLMSLLGRQVPIELDEKSLSAA
jgi:transcriptional antiterminator RfaH